MTVATPVLKLTREPCLPWTVKSVFAIGISALLFVVIFLTNNPTFTVVLVGNWTVLANT